MDENEIELRYAEEDQKALPKSGAKGNGFLRVVSRFMEEPPVGCSKKTGDFKNCSLRGGITINLHFCSKLI